MRGVRDAVDRYLARSFRPLPMWGVDDQGRCLCGGIDPRTRKPCNAGKHSRDEESWKSGRQYGPTDFTELDNIALALGPWRPGDWLVCLDVDGGRPELLARSMGLDLPPTLTQQSPRGAHLFFAVVPYEPLGNWNDVFGTKHREGWAVDVRYARGRVNVAPSRSAFGEYRWVDERAPIANLPRQFIRRVLDDRQRRGLEVQRRWERSGKRP